MQCLQLSGMVDDNYSTYGWCLMTGRWALGAGRAKI